MEPRNVQDKDKGSGMQMGSNPSQTGQPAETQTRGGTATGTVTQPARQQTSGRPERTEQDDWSEMKERGTEIVDKAKQTFNEAYDRTSRSLNESYGHAMDYGREHPGQAILIAFGVGVGVGLWLSSSSHTRSRTSRIIPPVMNALSYIAVEMFR